MSGLEREYAIVDKLTGLPIHDHDGTRLRFRTRSEAMEWVEDNAVDLDYFKVSLWEMTEDFCD